MKHATDWQAIQHVSEGTDAHMERRAPFRSVGHALGWYIEHGARLRAAKTTMGHALDLAELGLATDVGGRGSVLERDLALLSDVAACLPRPRGEEPAAGTPAALCGDTWGRWWALCASVQGGGDVDALASHVGRRMGRHVSAELVRAWLKAATCHVSERLRERGLVARGEGR